MAVRSAVYCTNDQTNNYNILSQINNEEKTKKELVDAKQSVNLSTKYLHHLTVYTEYA